MKFIKCVSVFSIAVLLAASLFGCKKETGNPNDGNQQINNPPAAMQSADSDFELKLASSSFEYDKVFTERDISAKYDESIYNITLSDNASKCDNPKTVINKNEITVNASGTYIISGKLTNGQIIVDAEDTDKIQLVLSNAQINKNSGAAILIRSAKKVFITLEENSKNTLTSTGEFEKTEDNKADGAIYSKENLTLNGKGSLNIASDYGHAIVCNDDMIITSGDYTISAENQAIKSNDSISFAGGNLKIKCGKDAVHCKNEDDTGKGNVYFNGASLDIEAQDNAFQASGYIIIDGGVINAAKCNEGIEAQKIEINGGDIKIASADDGINAASKTSSVNTLSNSQDKEKNASDSDENCYISISNATVVLNAGGDGIDSNGYFLQSGGNVTVFGAENSGNAALDYGTQAKITGGSIIALGYGGMAQGFNSFSTQGSILVCFDKETTEKFSLTDSSGKELAALSTDKKYNCVLVSNENIAPGQTYTANAGTQSKNIEMDKINYSDAVPVGNMPLNPKDPDSMGAKPEKPMN